MPGEDQRPQGRVFAREAKFWPFLVALGCVFLAHPVATHLGLDGWFRAAFMVVLVAGAYATGTERRHLITALALAVPAFLLQGAAIGVVSPVLDIVATGVTLLFLVYVTLVSFARVLAPGKVTSDRLVGSAVVYLLLGLVWSMIYTLQFIFDPAAFSGLVGDAVEGDELIYFSFVTLTTLGFGDISPATVDTRTTVWIEAAVGQLYLAILVARLVGIPTVVWGSKETDE